MVTEVLPIIIDVPICAIMISFPSTSSNVVETWREKRRNWDSINEQKVKIEDFWIWIEVTCCITYQTEQNDQELRFFDELDCFLVECNGA